MKSFIIENIEDTCYIDSILMGLFYNVTKLDDLLDKELFNSMGTYLQEYIKEHFVKRVRNNKSIMSEDIEMIRTISSHIGWKETNENVINNFYSFLMEIFENTSIDLGNNFASYIPLVLPESVNSINISEILDSSCIQNVPYLIGLSINRVGGIKTNVNIQKKISTKKTDIIHNTEWYFHAAICHKDTIDNDHYYTLLINNNKWFIFDDLHVPCIHEVKMDDPNVTNMIKKECVFLLYKLSKFY